MSPPGRRLDRATVNEAVAYLQNGEPPSRRRAWGTFRRWRSIRRWTLTGATALLSAGAAAVALAAFARDGLPGSLATDLQSLVRAARELLW